MPDDGDGGEVKVTLGEVNRNLNRLAGEMQRLSGLLEDKLREVEKAMVPREVYQIDRRNIVERFAALEHDLGEVIKLRDDDIKERRQFRWAAVAASVPLLAAIVTVLAGGHL